MLRFFRTTQSLAGLPLLAYALLVQLPYFLGVPAPSPGEGWGVWGNPVAAWVGAHPLLAQVALLFLLAIQGVQANVLAVRHNYARYVTQFAGVFLITALCLVPSLRTAHPAHFANVALLFALLALGRIYKNDDPAVPLFNAGAWVGLASLFVPPYLGFLLPLWIGIGVLGTLTARSFLRTAVGVFIVYFLGGTAYYVFGDFSTFSSAQTPALSIFLTPVTGPPVSICLGSVTLLTLVVLFARGKLVQFLNIQGKKGIQILYWVLLTTPVLLPFWGGIGPAALAPLCIVVGTLIGLRATEWPANRAAFVHFLLLVATFLVALL